jgi:hypothetical protein
MKEMGKSTQSRVGTLAHSVQEKALAENVTGDLLREYAEGLMRAQAFTHTERVDVLAKLPAIEDFVTRVAKFKINEGVTAEYIEHKLAIDASFRSVDFFDNKRALMRGVLDHGLRTGDNVLVLIDHKTGRKKPMKEHSTQFYCYMLLAMGTFPDLAGVQCAINYMGDSKLSWFPRYDGANGPWTPDEISRIVRPWLVGYLNSLSKPLQVLDSGDRNPETGWQCGFCGYVDNCPAGIEYVAAKAKRNTNV